MTKKVLLFIIFILLSAMVSGQQNLYNLPADKIVATIGSRYIAMSDIDNVFFQRKERNDTLGPDSKCDIMMEFITQKVLCEMAARDSVIIPEEEVDRELDDRIRSNIQNFGSKEQMEAVLGKSIYQIKEEYREEIREQLTAMQMQQMLTSEIVVTPEEVKKAYEELGPEQLPYISATVEIGQIIINPEASDEVEQYTKEKLEEVRQQIVTGDKDFSIMAGILSEDPGSRDNGGLVEIENKENFDATFASVAFRLNEGDVSPVFRSSFGYHIIKMERKGNSTATVRHILMVPAVTSVDIQVKMDYLDSVKKELEAGKITYGQAVAKLSNDELAKGRSGMMFDFNTGSTQLTLDQLDEQTASTIKDMKIGEYSSPHVFSNPYKNGNRGIRLLYLKSRIDPHTANFDTDYTLFQNYALREKKNKYMRDYIYDRSKTLHIRIDPVYKTCPTLAPLYPISTSSN